MTNAEKYSTLKLNHYEFKTYFSTVEWWRWTNGEFCWGGKCASLETAIEQAFEDWESEL